MLTLSDYESQLVYAAIDARIADLRRRVSLVRTVTEPR